MSHLRRNPRRNCLRLTNLHRMTHRPSCRLLNFRRRLSRLQKNHLRLSQHCCLLMNQRRNFRVCFERNCQVGLNY